MSGSDSSAHSGKGIRAEFIKIMPDVTVAGAGKTWTSDTHASEASQDRTIIVDPKDAATVLEALDQHIAKVYRPIDFKISEVTIGKRTVLAIGSADPGFYVGIGESRMLDALKKQGKIGGTIISGEAVGTMKFLSQLNDALHVVTPGNAAAPSVVINPENSISIKPDVTVTGRDGRHWVSVPSIKEATMARTFLVDPKDAPTMLEALDAHIAGIYKPINYKISEVTVNGRTMLAIGSADPDFYLGIGEDRLSTSLRNAGKIGVAYLSTAPLGSDRFNANAVEAASIVRPAEPGSQVPVAPSAQPAPVGPSAPVVPVNRQGGNLIGWLRNFGQPRS